MLSYNDVFDELQNYILNDENMQKSLKMKITNSNSKNEKPNSHYDIANVLLSGILHPIVFLCRIRVLLVQSGRYIYR